MIGSRMSEGGQPQTGRFCFQQTRKAAQIDAEPACISQLWSQADVGERWSRPETIGPVDIGQERLACFKTFGVRARCPCCDAVFRDAKFAQRAQHLEILNGMRIGCEHEREGTHFRALDFVGRKQGRRRIGLVEPFDDWRVIASAPLHCRVQEQAQDLAGLAPDNLTRCSPRRR
jgi:hypothetical protein